MSKGSSVYTETWSVDNCNTSKKFLTGFPIFIWDATTGKCQRTLMGHVKEASQVAYSPDGKHVASASKDAIQIWDTTTWTCVKILTATHHDRITEEFFTIVYSPDSKQLAASFSDSERWQTESQAYSTQRRSQWRIRVFDTSTWDSINLTQHMVSTASLAYSPDGKQLAPAMETTSMGTLPLGASTSGTQRLESC